jgi:hypothetical protein
MDTDASPGAWYESLRIIAGVRTRHFLCLKECSKPISAAMPVKTIDKTDKNGKDRGLGMVEVPGIWRVLTTVIRVIPERVFKKLNL